MYLFNPIVMGIFVYTGNGKIDIPVEYLDNREQITFLKNFVLERNLPMIVFGE